MKTEKSGVGGSHSSLALSLVLLVIVVSAEIYFAKCREAGVEAGC